MGEVFKFAPGKQVWAVYGERIGEAEELFGEVVKLLSC